MTGPTIDTHRGVTEWVKGYDLGRFPRPPPGPPANDHNNLITPKIELIFCPKSIDPQGSERQKFQLLSPLDFQLRASMNPTCFQGLVLRKVAG